MTSQPTLKVACLGAGYFAQFHYDGWRRINRTELVGSADQNLEKAADTGLPAFQTLDEMLAATKPDLLDIITPPPSHFDAVSRAIEHGVSTIICQKPFCESLVEAHAAVALAEKAGVLLVIHENFRFQPWYRVMKAAMDAGDIGNVQQMTVRLRTGDGQGPDAYLDRQPYFQKMPRLLIHETGVHWVDTFRFMFGEPNGVYADLRKMNPVIAGEDSGYFLLDYPSGVKALFDGNRLLDHAAENCRVTLGEALLEGTGGAMSLWGDGSVTLRRFGETTSETLLKTQSWAGFGGDCVRALNQHVVEGVLDGTPVENEARDYLKVITVEKAIYESDAQERKIREFDSA